MLAVTLYRGLGGDSFSILDLLSTLLGEPKQTASLASLGVDRDGLMDLWDAVCEEFAERSVGPELEPDDLDVSWTVKESAEAMTKLLVSEPG